MKKLKLTNIKLIVLFMVLVMLAACSQHTMDGQILVSEIPARSAGETGLWSQAEADGARIIAVDPNKSGSLAILTKDFISAVSPTVSYDGKKMLFAAKKEAGDHWQIWEMHLSSGKSHQITTCEVDCLNPSYLPNGRLGFTKRLGNDKYSACDMVFTANLDGSNMQQVSFSPQSFAALTTLNDGRFLAMEKQVFPDLGIPKLMVMRPDGTKLELFYKPEKETEVLSKPVETKNKEILFIEKNGKASDIVSLDYNLPLHSRRVLTSAIQADFYAVSCYRNGKLLTVYRNKANENLKLATFNPGESSLNDIYQNEDYKLVEAVLVRAANRPKDLPSEVQLQENSGLLMCQDINFKGFESLKDDGTRIKAEKIEIIGLDSTLEVGRVEADGSFYLKVEADVPFRIRTLTANNEVVSGPGSWYYIRPNERRACVGCHTGPEIAPFNRQPLAVRKEPVVVTTHSKVRLNANSRDYEHE